MKNKMKNKTENKLINVTIYKINEDNLEDAKKNYQENIKTEWLHIDDLHEKYFVKIDYTQSDDIKSIEPDEVHPFDQYELTESIIQKGKELGIKIGVHQPDATIDPEAIKKFKELALEKIRKNKKDSPETKNVSEH